jgi:hypothetical protein
MKQYLCKRCNGLVNIIDCEERDIKIWKCQNNCFTNPTTQVFIPGSMPDWVISVDVEQPINKNLQKITAQQFNILILQPRLELIKDVLGIKHEEYSVDDNYLINFIDGATFDGTTPEITLWGYLKKQLVSVMKMVKSSPEKEFKPEFVSEKIGDCINYLILLEAMMYCRRTK